MQNLLRFIVRYNFFLLFLVLQFVALSFMIGSNPIQRGKLNTGINSLSSFIYEKSDGLTQYLHLRQTNEDLLKENAQLRSVVNTLGMDSANLTFQGDYTYLPATIINNSINKSFNYITLDKGSDDGIETDMGVLSSFGVVGIIKNVTPNFSRVISVLNSELRVSVKLADSEYFGSLNWPGKDYQTVLVSEIPSHVRVEAGDSILTSGYSSIFPPNQIVAYVEEVEASVGGSFLTIRARLSNDFKRLSKVLVVRNNRIDELKLLEQGYAE